MIDFFETQINKIETIFSKFKKKNKQLVGGKIKKKTIDIDSVTQLTLREIQFYLQTINLPSLPLDIN